MQTFTSTIKDRIQETHDVITLVLSKPDDFSYISGQYCLVSILGNKKFPDESRPFTFTSSMTDVNLQLTIKIMGEFTGEVEKLKLGDKLEISGPNGEELNFDEKIKNDVIFIAGGSGITPFISAIRYAIKKDLKNNITLLYSNRTEDDIIYKKELDSIDIPNIKIIQTITDNILETWKGETGYISEGMIRKHINDLENKLWYICGPPPMTKAMRDILEKMNIQKDNIKIEPWEIPGKSG